jgi:uncharacterized membrane protein
VLRWNTYVDTSGTHGFLMHQGSFTTIDVPDATATFARGLNAQGDVVGGYMDTSGRHGFLLHQGTLTTLEDPSGAGTLDPFGINTSGDIVGLYLPPLANHGFLLAHS